MGCFSGCLISAASDQKLFCKLCSPFNCSFHEFVGEKEVSPSYSSAILTPPAWPISYMYYDPSFHLFYLLTLAFMCKSWPLRFDFGTPSWLPLFWTFAGNLVAIVMLINSGLQPRQV